MKQTIGFIICCIIAAVIIKCTSNENNKTDTPYANLNPYIYHPPSLFSSIEDFKQKFNQLTETLNTPTKIEDLTIIEGRVRNSFTHIFTNDFAISGVINKEDKSVTEIYIVFQPEGAIDNTWFFNASLMIIAICDPSIPPNKRRDIITHLGLESNIIGDIKSEYIQNGIKYWINTQGLDIGLPISFGAEKLNDNKQENEKEGVPEGGEIIQNH